MLQSWGYGWGEAAYAKESKLYTETKALGSNVTPVDSVTGESVLENQYLDGFWREAREMFFGKL